jgi:hypothetical protein
MASEAREIAYSAYHEIIVYELRASIRRYNDQWEDVLWKRLTNSPLHALHIEQYRLPIILLSCTLLECVINFYLCMNCDAKRFRKLEREGLLDKWTKIPKEFNSKYSVPPTIAVDLKKLIDRRVSIVHPKPYLSMDGDNRHTGNHPSVDVDENDFVGLCSRLPLTLLDNLLSAEGRYDVLLHSIRIWCGAAANEFDSAQRRLKQLFEFPRELIEEIMQQGYDRRKAVTIAIFLGDNPEAKKDASGNYVIYPHGKMVIKPLKYFEDRTG